jgi:ATP-binding cassette subfamily B protein
MAWVLRRQAGWATVLALASLASTAALLLRPAMLGRAVDDAVAGELLSASLVWTAAVFAVILVAEAVTELADPWSTADATAGLRRRLLGHVLALDTRQGRRLDAGDVVSRLVSSAPETAAAAPAIIEAVGSAVSSIGGVAALWLIDWRLAVAFLTGVPLGALLIGLFARRAAELTASYQTVQGRIAARLVDALAGIRTIRAAGAVDRETERVLLPLEDLAVAGRGMWRAYGQVVWRSMLLVPLMEIAVLIVAGLGVVQGRLSPGQLLATVGYVSLGLGFFEQTDIMMRLSRIRGSARRLAEVLGVPAMAPGHAALPPGDGELVLRDVTVRADGTVLLDRLTLRVPAGVTLAVVGRSGAGKSTLAEVAGRLCDPDRGQVLLDGADLAMIRPDALRRGIGYAFERPALLGATVAGMIGYGRGLLPMASVTRAARTAHADAFIRRLPSGYSTPLATLVLSDGEVQRLGLARSLTGDGRLLILDDATSNLDSVTEMELASALTSTLPGRTRLIVTHRASTAARADLVAWLEAGRIREVAPHAWLWRHPDYRAVFQHERDNAVANGDGHA